MRFNTRCNGFCLGALTLLHGATATPTVNQRCSGPDCRASNVQDIKRSPQTSNAPLASKFVWSAIGDSWTSGVAYSPSTVYSNTDTQFCYRSTEAWGAQMEGDSTWTVNPQEFHFAGCGGTLLDDIPNQLGRTGNSQLMIGTLGGNNGFFGDIARACIYQPRDGTTWGPTYDQDPNGEGLCKQNLKKSRDYINGYLKNDFTGTLQTIFSYKQGDGQAVDRFDFYLASYVEFWDATTDPCDGWSFGRWFSASYPPLVKELRSEMNDLVNLFNSVQIGVINSFAPPDGMFVHQLATSDQFQGHRFCEAQHSEEDQWTSADVWIWNLQWNNGDTGGQSQPSDAPNGPLPIMSLETQNRTDLDNQVFNDVNANSQSGFGWTARPFHPKPLGNIAMKNFFIQSFKNDQIPGVGAPEVNTASTIGETGLPGTTIAPPSSTASIYCSNPSLEDGDGLCTCVSASTTFTTFTPSGGPGNSCQVTTFAAFAARGVDAFGYLAAVAGTTTTSMITIPTDVAAQSIEKAKRSQAKASRSTFRA